MKLRILAQQFLGAFVLHHRREHLHVHDLIAALAAARIEHALFAQPEFLSVVGALRDLQQRPPVDGRDFNFGAQSSLPRPASLMRTGTLISMSSPWVAFSACAP